MSGTEAVERMQRLSADQAQGGGAWGEGGAWSQGGRRPLLVLVGHGGDTQATHKADVLLPSLHHLRYTSYIYREASGVREKERRASDLVCVCVQL
jgi:hypothetical protein